MTLFLFNHCGLTTNKFSMDTVWTLSKRNRFLSDIVLNLLDMSDVQPLFCTLTHFIIFLIAACKVEVAIIPPRRR